jgi:2,3-dihydroxy-p-cumate/2,3-dihydroxybenzoate 3,4-dioxygenase
MIRYRKLGYVELNVTDRERARAFYEETVGLQYVRRGAGGEDYYRCSDDHHSVVLHPAREASLKRVGFMLEDERQFNALEESLGRHGTPSEEIARSECSERFLARGLRMVEPYTQATFEFYVPASNGSATFTPTLAKIQRLGHVVLWTPQPERACAYLRDVLNFRDSDEIGEEAAFMRPFPTPWHHGIGIFKAERPGLHHVNFMVTEIDDIGRAHNRLRAHGVPIAKGIGRHPVSGSVFLYFFDPDGLTLEYSFGMEQFAEAEPRDATRWPYVPESFDAWGAPRHPEYPRISAIETPSASLLRPEKAAT